MSIPKRTGVTPIPPQGCVRIEVILLWGLVDPLRSKEFSSYSFDFNSSLEVLGRVKGDLFIKRTHELMIHSSEHSIKNTS
jgi:hypothetical protein|uniref:Uncharacterized protein n=1 Tax=Picea glauca TaxID=3330 RepID=A0A101M2Q4_PICGL|nr:hypothetical protein ABT39_MTgene3039 [Picea glauca]QHR91950.1 hypothetical protein Q903MT_gene5986 [Picea sitchensis]